jgi:hypothetical protein
VQLCAFLFQGSFGGAVGFQVMLGGQAVGLAWAVWVVQHDGHHSLTRFALAEEAAGSLVVYRAAAERTAHMRARDGALFGVKINRTAIRPDDFDLQRRGLWLGISLRAILLLSFWRARSGA